MGAVAEMYSLEKYLSVVGDEGCVDMLEIEQDFPNLYTDWPSFIKLVSLKGSSQSWIKYIKKNNYHFTHEIYCDGEHYQYTDWLTSRNFVDLVEIVENLCTYGFPSFLTRYEELISQLKIEKHTLCKFAIRGDRKNVLETVGSGCSWISSSSSSSTLWDMLNQAIVSRANLCVSYLVELLTAKKEVTEISDKTISLLFSYGDYQIAKKLEKPLKVAQSYTNLSSVTKDELVSIVGSKDQIVDRMEKRGAKDRLFFLQCIATRMVGCQVLQALFEKYLHLERSSELGADSYRLLEFVLSSNRNVEATKSLLLSMESAGFPLCSDFRISICSLTPNSWKAIQGRSGSLLSKFHYCSRENNNMCRDFFKTENRKLIKSMVSSLCPFMDDESLSNTLCDLGSSLTSWALAQRFMSSRKSHLLQKSLALTSAEKGNLCLLERCLFNAENCDKPIYERDFVGKIVHKESRVLLKSWFGNCQRAEEDKCLYKYPTSTERQSDEVSYLYDTSSYSCREYDKTLFVRNYSFCS